LIQGDNEAGVISGFKYLGFRYGRDDATYFRTPNQFGGDAQELCDVHAATGVLYSELPINFLGDGSVNAACTDGQNDSTECEWQFLLACGALGFAEGPNEPNNFGFTYKGQGCNGTTMVGCVTYMKDLYAMVHSAFAGMPLWGMSEVGSENEDDGLQFLTVPAGTGTLNDGVTFADGANAHNYVAGNGPAGNTPIDNHSRYAETIARSGPYAGLWDAYGEYWGTPWRSAGLGLDFPGASTGQDDRPKITTETSWNIFKGPVGEAMKGNLIVDMLLDSIQLGWTRTIVYQMFNARPNDAGYGFCNNDGTQTVCDASNAVAAGVDMHNLTSILADSSSSFTPTTPGGYSVSGLPTSSQDPAYPFSAYTLLVEKANGTYESVTWGEAFQSQKITDVTVHLGAVHQNVNVYDITVDPPLIQTLASTDTVVVPVKDHAVIVEFK
jgi:hypothetical protein